MDSAKRELLVARIVSGSIRCKVKDHRGELVVVRIAKPTRLDQYEACEVYVEVYEESQYSSYSEDELMAFLLERGLWDEKREKLIEGIPKDIEKLKVGLFQMSLKESEREKVRKSLGAARKKLGELSLQRHAYDHLSCSGAAQIAKSRYLIGKSLFTSSGVPFFPGDDFWDQPSTLLDNVMTWLAANRLDDGEIRELARNDPWRSIWLAQKVEGSLFGVAAVDHTDEQRALLTWSTIYENAYQHSDCPSDQVIDDDDMFDGWMIVQRRKREEEQKNTTADSMLNRKIGDSQEVYLIANNSEEAKKIHDLNDEHGQKILKQRRDALAKQGTVREMDMPDTKQRYRMAVAAKLAADLRNRRG